MSQKGEAIASPRLMPYAGECSTQERWCVQFGKGTQHRDSGGCPFSSLPRATKPSLSSHNVVPLLAVLPLLKSPGWVAVNVIFVCWSFKRVPDFLADAHLSLVDRIPAGFHSQMLCGLLFLTGALDLGAWCEVETPTSSGGTFAAGISLWILGHCMWVYG